MNEFVSTLCRKMPDFDIKTIVRNSALTPALDSYGDGTEILKSFLLRKPVRHILEIGTYRGLSAGFMAQFAKVTTIDVDDDADGNSIKYKVWDALGVSDKIDAHLVETEEEKKKIIDGLDFDVAFVDGNHFGEGPRDDFEMVKHCGRVILHDYHPDFPDVVRFVDSFEPKLEIKGLFVYWEDSTSPKVMFPEFKSNLGYVKKYFKGKGLDMGCGCCPLTEDNCIHVDHSPQPVEVDFVHADCASFKPKYKVDYVFSSHMLEDLPTEGAIIDCLLGWAKLLKKGGVIVLLLPDMQASRYPTVEDGGNPSHRVNVGVPFIDRITPRLKGLKLIQMDTIPHSTGCTLDVVFRKGTK